MKKNFKAKSLSILSTAALLSALIPHASAEVSLTDISNSYAKDAIIELVEKGIINGTGDGKFNPTSNIQRQDFAIILARALKLDLSNPPQLATFKDVQKSNYAFAAVEAVVKAGLFKGMGDGTFGINQNITREQMAVIFVKALGVNSAGKGQNLKFSDASSIASWAKDAVGAAVEFGLMKGNPDGTFGPANQASRQDVALVASKFLAEKTKVDEQESKPPVTPTPTPVPTPTPTPGGGGIPENTADQEAANPVKAEIAALPVKLDITLVNKAAVTKARTDFDALTAAQKTLVGDITKLIDAEAAIVELEAQAAADQEAANPVKAEIAALPAKADITLVNKAAVTKARTDYDALTADQKTLVGDITKLIDAEAAIVELEAQAAADQEAANPVKAEIAALPAKADITLVNKAAVTKARTDYDALTADQKTLVGDITKLIDAEAAIVELEAQAAADQEAANPVKAEIAALPAKADITLVNKAAVTKARTDYDALTAVQKTLVGDITKLTDAEAAIVELEAQAAADQAAANPVKAEIAALPAKADITLVNKAAVTKARTDFDALTAVQQTLVGDITKLIDAEAAIVELEAQAAADQAAANLVKAEIAALPAKADITLVNKAAVTKARTDFDALTAVQQTLVGDITKLIDAEAAIVELEAQAAADQAAANLVKAEIAALPAKADITLVNKAAVTKARTDFDALTAVQQTLVGDITKLIDAEAAIVELEAQAAADQAAANLVKAEIAALPAKADITLVNKAAVTKARTDFDALTAVQKTLVGDITKLIDAEAAIVELEAQAAADQAAANLVKAEIAALPAKADITLVNKAAVTKARTDYEALTAVQKTLVGDITKLIDAEVAIVELEAQAAADLAAATPVKAEIAALPAKADITLVNKAAVTKARTDFDALTAVQQTLVGDITKLTDAEAAIVELGAQAAADLAAANPVKAEIAALPAKADITLVNKAAVTKARTDYEALTAAQKTLVGDITKLTDAEAAIVELETQAAADQEAANPVKAEIVALPAKADITLVNKAAVTKARTDYEALTAAQKTLVGDITKLTDAEAAIVELETQAAADLAAANSVKVEIAALPAKADITLMNKAAVTKARTDFDALTVVQQTLVGDITKLTDAEAAIVELEAQAAADQAAANSVKAEIAALPAKADITLVNKAAVTKARTDYEALTAVQQTLVGDITKLIDAEAAIVELEAQAAADQAAANPVKAEIAALPAKADITLVNKAAVTKARTDYEALTAAQKTLVGDITKLTDAEAAIVELEALAAADLAAANPVKAEIAALPAKADITLVNKAAVTKARTDYEALTDAQKTLVGDITKLTDAEAAIDLVEVAIAKGNLNVSYNGIDDKVILPIIQDGAAVTWILKDSTQSSIVDVSNGSIKRAGLTANTDIVLIATITSGTISDTREFTINVKSENSEPETITSKAITTFDFSTVGATQAREESKIITSTDFKSNPKHFTISDGTVTIPVDLTWNIPLNGFTTGQVVGSAVDSFIQDYCNAHGIDLGKRTVNGVGFGDTFFISTFKTGSAASITLGGKDWSFFFQNSYYTGTDDHTKNRTFIISDGVKIATILLKRRYTDMADLVSDLNDQLKLASVSATAEKVNENQFKLVSNSADITLSITGKDKNQFFGD
ncbi:S-layer homology domain-containing protein [Bacillus sp. FJAT-28004]|uniref:S-layer homology domain-containing protein n=1 Tax=Bacillus sp. FJAT-28004 TaxID=1679165 RepID=UPI0006B5737C|nr:S-layer homology domain-containing protein [Bacillus sp. FJAT-28004]